MIDFIVIAIILGLYIILSLINLHSFCRLHGYLILIINQIETKYD